jgi:hypothetical protein
MKLEAMTLVPALRPLASIGILAVTLAACGGAGGQPGSSAPSSTSSQSSSTGSPSAAANSQASVALSSSSYTAAPASGAVITIYRVGSPQGTATVGYSTVNGTATAGADFVQTSGQVSWADGDSTPRQVVVPVSNAANGKHFMFALTSLVGQVVFGSPAVATVGVNGIAAASSGAVTLSWAAPTENTDGSALTNLAGYDIYYGASAASMDQKITIATVGMESYVISDLPSGTWYFRIVAVNALGLQSAPSSTVSTTI